MGGEREIGEKVGGEGEREIEEQKVGGKRRDKRRKYGISDRGKIEYIHCTLTLKFIKVNIMQGSIGLRPY